MKRINVKIAIGQIWQFDGSEPGHPITAKELGLGDNKVMISKDGYEDLRMINDFTKLYTLKIHQTGHKIEDGYDYSDDFLLTNDFSWDAIRDGIDGVYLYRKKSGVIA